MAKSELIYALKPEEWCADILGFTPDAWQTTFLRTNTNMATMTSRQAGKSTICAAKVLHTALYNPGTQSAICSPTLRQSQLMSSTINGFIKHMKPSDAPKLLTDSQSMMRFENGSIIYSLPGSDAASLRGYAISGIVCIDECFFFDDAAWVAVAPMVAVAGGKVLAMGTPAGPFGWAYDLWQSQPKGWQFIKVPADEVARITPEYLVETRERMTLAQFRSEFYCEFGNTQSSLWASEDIEAMFR